MQVLLAVVLIIYWICTGLKSAYDEGGILQVIGSIVLYIVIYYLLMKGFDLIIIWCFGGEGILFPLLNTAIESYNSAP